MSDLQLGENDFSEMVIKYMARHPERQKDNDGVVAAIALREAFPCPVE